MNDKQENKIQTPYQRWSQTVTGMLTWPLNLFETQCDVGLKIVEVALRLPSVSQAGSGEPSAAARTGDPFPKLEALAFERMRQGLALPREIYQAQYRDRVDWLKFPEWARPTDPEMFQKSGHEG